MPILYSFRRCPYAIRARMALYLCKQSYSLREVNLADKPDELLIASPKGTVPVLVLDNGTVIDESLAIIDWAHAQSADLFENLEWPRHSSLVERLDSEFKPALDGYKYPEFHEHMTQQAHRQLAERFLTQLEAVLSQQQFLHSNSDSLLDIAIMPFIRQFAAVDKEWFDTSPYTRVKDWLSYWLASEVFTSVMKKYEPFKTSHQTYAVAP